MPQLARLYGIRPQDIDHMPPGEIQAFLADMHETAERQRRQLEATNAKR